MSDVSHILLGNPNGLIAYYDLPEFGGARRDPLELKKGLSDGFGVLLTDMVSNSGPLSDKFSNSSINSSISIPPPLRNNKSLK